ncbi:C-type lectin domain family 3 member A-like isoform X1 [Brachyistius frenatus]|uniref:C-type lectin domain family 3 member A-like isoform X1 n=1 Tax=Brachyistius frenatus TaxID=100188 RepID=UPI0037E7B9EC
MENSQKWTNDSKGRHFGFSYEILRQGVSTFPNYRLVILCLGLLNAVLLITAVVIGVKCAKVKEVSYSAAPNLIDELNYLRGNCSDATEAADKAKRALESALKNHAQLKAQIKQQEAMNNNYQRKIEALWTEKTNLQSNKSALEETCGRCLPGWSLLNSSCYLFSYKQSSTAKKNWPDSRADCISRGSDLVVIDDQEEQRLVSVSIEKMRGGQDRSENGFWIGLRDTETEGTWVWINNIIEVEQRYWMEGEPKNSLHQAEDCGVTFYSSTGPWQTRYGDSCSQKQKYWICEMISS